MQSSEVQINELLTAGIDLDMVLSEYEALEKVNDSYLNCHFQFRQPISVHQ